MFNKKTDFQVVKQTLLETGFKRYSISYASADYTFWKNFKGEYQIGCLIYDLRPHSLFAVEINVIAFVVLLNSDVRIEMSVSGDTIKDIAHIEKIAKEFYNKFNKLGEKNGES